MERNHRHFHGETKESALAEVRDAATRAGCPDASVFVLTYEEAAYTGKVYPTEKYYPTWVLEESSPLAQEYTGAGWPSSSCSR